MTLMFCSVLPMSAFGQSTAEEPYVIPSNESGEIHSMMSDMMRAEAIRSGERLFVILRLGTGETAPRLAGWRLRAVKQYLLQGGVFDSQPAVFAEGERVEGEGRFEYYLGSQLQFITLAPKNKLPNFTCCEDYFPPAKRKTRRRKN